MVVGGRLGSLSTNILKPEIVVIGDLRAARAWLKIAGADPH
jgi:hypothetical protein